MCKTNLWIIEELFSKLTELKINKKFFKRKTDFTRNYVFTFEVMFSIICNLPRRSLAIEVREGLASFNKLYEKNKEGTNSGFCKARKKIKFELFRYINQYLIDLFYSAKNINQIKRWNGFILIGIDGTLLDLVDTLEVRQKFGYQMNQFGSQVQGRMMIAYDVLNDQIKNCALASYFKGEATIIKDWICTMGQDNLCIYDRLFPSLNLICRHDNNKVPYLMRCKLGFNNYVKSFVKSRKKDVIQEWKITKLVSTDLKKSGFNIEPRATIKVRLIKVVLSTGEIEVLATSLLCRRKFPLKIFKDLYFKRWGVETKIGFLKNILQIELHSGKNVESILQDFYGTIIRSNIQSLIELDCEEQVKEKVKTRKLDYKINHSIAAGVLKNHFAQLLFIQHRTELYEELIRIFVMHLVPIRPDRELPRIRKANKLSGKYRPLKNYKKIA